MPLAGIQFFYEAWLELSSCRDYALTDGPIPFLAVDAYARRCCMEETEFWHFLRLIRSVDNEYLAYKRSKRPIKEGREEEVEEDT